MNRRDLLLAGAAALMPRAQAATGKLRYAVLGVGVRGCGLWGEQIRSRYSDRVDFVALCDSNPQRVEVARRRIGVECPVFTSFDEMCDRAKPDTLMITTVDSTHAGYIVRALQRGIHVITEKPMVVDEAQCQAVLDAEKKAGKRITVTFNYRYAPKHQKIKELLLAGEIGRVLSVDFSWYLDTGHGADYFRRWHRLKKNSGSLWVHKATHHFDLMNWWLAADPSDVTAQGGLKYYGRSGPFRHSHCRPCPHKGQCKHYWDITKSERLTQLYVNCESADGYLRDGCVYREDIDIWDTMSALVRYSNGVTMNYSVNAFMPIEGYRVAFNGDRGRLEIRDYEDQPWKPESETEIHLIRNFGKREIIPVPRYEGDHGGGDKRLTDLIFAGASAPEYMKLPDSRAGAMSCLTGIAARRSIEQNRTIRIRDLVNLL
ncbi:MAG: Gfo/Idh/MocA family oxidoreductase [Bryobacteraceae bacterium]|nr:Gfo/Idh/MocA family oxidoreductase [Bryobacteraceae bacterium]